MSMLPAHVAMAMLLLAGPPSGSRERPASEMKSATEIFESELTKRGVAFSRKNVANLYVVDVRGVQTTVSLENISRTYARDGDPRVVASFVDQVFKHQGLPGWEKARSLVYWSAEPADHDFGTTIRKRVSDKVSQVLVVTDLEEGKVTWLTPELVSEWQVSEKVIRDAASENLSRLLDGKRPQVEAIDGMKLGMVPVPSVFKASVVFAPRFKAFVAADIGWPVLVVIPCRDFIYVLAEKDRALLNRMGGVVQREYRESGYPITTEVLRVSDQGIEAIGAFPE